MSSNISSIGGNNTMTMQSMRDMKRPDPTQMADQLFSKLDTSGQGYLTKVDLQSALDNVSSSSTNSLSRTSSSADQLFSKLDTNGDGKVTKQEFSDTLKKVADQLDNQFMSMRMNGGMQEGGMGSGMRGMMMEGTPPPSADNGGMTKDQLTSLVNNIGSSDSTASSKISDLLKNFDKSDTNGDGKVNMQEAMTYNQANSSSGSSSTSSMSNSSSANSTSDVEKKLLQQIAQLMQAYGIGNDQSSQSGISSLLSTISVSA